MLTSILFAIPALMLQLPVAPSPAGECQLTTLTETEKDELAVAHFDRLVSEYVELHRRLERPLPPERLTSDPEQIQLAADSLADAIRETRPMAQAGDIFRGRIADVFRFRIRQAARGEECDVMALLTEMEDDALEGALHAEVNGAFPWGAGNMMWPSILWTLPALPQELEYRFVGPDLVLLDVHANLVVDVLEGALPAN